MNVALRSGWGAPQLVLSALTVAVVAASPFGVLHNFQSVQLSSILPSFQARPAPAAAPSELKVVANPPAPPFVLRAKSWAERRQAIRCLAQAVYFEAGFQPIEGQRAVAQVILNRVRDKIYPSTVCGVVYEGWRRRTGCQFSFACDGSLHRRPPTADEMQSAETIARQALSGYVVPTVGTATAYHNDHVEPYWRTAFVKVAQIGDHIFYRQAGRGGQPQALDPDRYEGDEIHVANALPRLAVLG